MMNASSPQSDAGDRGTAGVIVFTLAAVLAASACGASRTTVRTAPVASLSEAIECSLETGREMGFEAISIDRTNHRVVLERRDPEVDLSEPSFQRAVGQLTAEEAEREPGAQPALSVEARTYYEFFNRRGRTRRQREASDDIQAAADSVLSACASGPSSAAESGAGAARGVPPSSAAGPGGG